MKELFLNNSMNAIKNSGNYSDTKLEEIRYGLEGIYLTFTKTIILLSLAFIFGIVKEFILLLVFYNILRLNAFGLHASKSIHCLIFSTILFIGGALLCKYINIPSILMIVTSLICLLFICIYAPADTYKRPIINKKKRKRFKILSVLSGIIYILLIIIYNKYSIVNYIWIGLIAETIMILPISYKILKLPYANYKKYK